MSMNMTATTNSSSSVPHKSRTHTILSAFPKRPMSVIHSRLDNPWISIAFFIISTIFLCFFPIFETPDLIDDYRISKHQMKDNQAQVDGTCRVMRHILISCDVSIVYQPNPESPQVTRVRREFSYLGYKTADTIAAFRSEKNPTLITTDLEIKQLKNRTIVLVVWCLFFFFVSLYTGLSILEEFKFRRMLRSKVMLKPVVAEVTEISEKNAIRFSTSFKGKKRFWNNTFRENEAPLFLSTESTLALAVTLHNAPFMLLLDNDFSCLDFTEDEEARLRSAISA